MPEETEQADQVTDEKWYSSLNEDLKGTPMVQRYNSQEEFIKGALELEKTLGSENRVRWPKDENDQEGWGKIWKKMGLPDDPNGYELDDYYAPDDMASELVFDKKKFSEILHKHNAPPALVKGLWQDYTKMMTDAYTQAKASNETQLQNMRGSLRKEFGDAYESKVALAKQVIGTFGGDDENKNALFAELMNSPRALKLLIGIGGQFTESQIGDFKGSTSYAMTPQKALEELNAMKDMSSDKWSEDYQIRQKALQKEQELIAILEKAGIQY